MTGNRNKSVQSVERAVDILKSFSPQEPEFGVGELSRRVGLAKSTVFRLLSTLESCGLVAQNPETDLYHLGVEIIILANSVFLYSDLRQIARPHLRSLVNTIGETASISVLVDREIINLYQFEFSGRLVVRAGSTGLRMPFYAASAGKAIAAFLPEDDLEILLASPMNAFTSTTITEPEALRAELSTVRERGFATAFDELEDGLHAVAAPIFNHEGNAIACISVSGPSYRLSRERILEISPHVRQAAERISQEMGYTWD
jgi:DNA-binding IclR family transcriptional regulator